MKRKIYFRIKDNKYLANKMNKSSKIKEKSKNHKILI